MVAHLAAGEAMSRPGVRSVEVAFLPADLERVRCAARRAGASMSAWIRAVALDVQAPEEHRQPRAARKERVDVVLGRTGCPHTEELERAIRDRMRTRSYRQLARYLRDCALTALG